MLKELNIFIDPKTKEKLALKIQQESGGQVITGKLYSDRHSYPVISGIPRFVGKSFYAGRQVDSPEYQTTRSFGVKWREKRNRALGCSKEDVRDLKEQFMAILGCETEFRFKNILKNCKISLNAGCGVAWPEYLFNYNPRAQKHCIDISLSVEQGYAKTKELKNVIVSQASIFQLPYPDNIFDIIYSNGVIHHTVEPRKALQELIRKLAPGGLIGIYIYAKKPFLRELADSQIMKITTAMSYRKCMEFSRQMTSLGEALSKIKQPLVIGKDIELLNIKKGKYALQRFIYDYFLKCWFNPRRDTLIADLINQDWYHPYYASHHTKEEVFGWLRESGMRYLKCLQPPGWEHSGYFISGRKA